MKQMLVFGFSLLLAGCGAASRQEPKSAEAASSPNDRADRASPAPAAPAQESAVEAAQPTPSAPGSVSASGPSLQVAPAIRLATEDLERGRRELERAGHECTDACRALSSMDRAAGRICGLEVGTHCDYAKDNLYSARDRVRTSCGVCTDGTETARNAPVPSR